METAAAQGGGANMLFMILLFVGIIVIMFSGRGQKKREQERLAKVNALQKGDGVIIPGGIVGTVAGFKDEMVEVKIAENVKITVLKNAIVGFVNDAQPAQQQGGSK